MDKDSLCKTQSITKLVSLYQYQRTLLKQEILPETNQYILYDKKSVYQEYIIIPNVYVPNKNFKMHAAKND